MYLCEKCFETEKVADLECVFKVVYFIGQCKRCGIVVHRIIETDVGVRKGSANIHSLNIENIRIFVHGQNTQVCNYTPGSEKFRSTTASHTFRMTGDGDRDRYFPHTVERIAVDIPNGKSKIGVFAINTTTSTGAGPQPSSGMQRCCSCHDKSITSSDQHTTPYFRNIEVIVPEILECKMNTTIEKVCNCDAYDILFECIRNHDLTLLGTTLMRVNTAPQPESCQIPPLEVSVSVSRDDGAACSDDQDPYCTYNVLVSYCFGDDLRNIACTVLKIRKIITGQPSPRKSSRTDHIFGETIPENRGYILKLFLESLV